MNGKNKNKHILSGQSGQVLIESLLLMFISIGLLGMTLRYLRDTKVFSSLTKVVWAGVAQMTEYGNWPSASGPVHPNSSIRTRLLDPKK